MKKGRFFLIILFWISTVSHGQQAGNFFIEIKDNTGIQYVSNDYTITDDSLFIRGDSDYGRKKVDYLRRKLTKAEKRQIIAFMKTYPIDSLDDVYFNEFNNLGYISADHFPRVVEVEGIYKGKNFKTKMTNCYAAKIVNVCELMNKLVPGEVRIKLRKEDFNAFYP